MRIAGFQDVDRAGEYPDVGVEVAGAEAGEIVDVVSDADAENDHISAEEIMSSPWAVLALIREPPPA